VDIAPEKGRGSRPLYLFIATHGNVGHLNPKISNWVVPTCPIRVTEEGLRNRHPTWTYCRWLSILATMNLNLITSLDPIGYGYVGRFILKELTTAGVQVALFPLSYNLSVSDDPLNPVRLGLANAAQYDPAAPSVRIAQARTQAEHVGRGKHVAFPIFELDRLDAAEIHHLNQMDAVLVCSQWAAGVVASSGVSVPIIVAPLGVDRSIFHESIAEGQGPTRDQPAEPGPTIFVNNGKWEWRKGHDFLLQAFCNAFTASDNITLKLLSRSYILSDEGNDSWARVFLGSSIGTRVQLVPRLASQRDVAALLADCDCGVFPSRAEGWNLGLLECMSMGLTVIATNYSAHTEFVEPANCRLVQIDETEPPPAGDVLWGTGNWGKLGGSQMEQMVYHLREVHRLKQEGSLRRNDAGIATAKKFTWRRTAEAVLRAVE
jgi:glycosyltransferase involved in cell wall biosynthesis